MDWFQSRAAQLIGLVSIVGTLAGFGYTGATYVNRIENLEKKIGRLEGTEDAQQEIEERFSAIETSVEYINKTIDDSIVPEVKENANMVKVLDLDISTVNVEINNLIDSLKTSSKSSKIIKQTMLNEKKNDDQGTMLDESQLIQE